MRLNSLSLLMHSKKRFQYDVKKTALPAKPDYGKIEELLVEINKSYLRRVI